MARRLLLWRGIRPSLVARAVSAWVLLAVALAACTPPVRQFDLKNQPLTCEQANACAYRTLQTMGFTITAFDPAVADRAGQIRGTREDRRTTQDVTVGIRCTAAGAHIDASEDGRWLNRVDFKRAFYMAFTATAAQAAATTTAAREESARPLQQKTTKGLQVLIEPVRGLGAKLDFDLDLAAAGILPVLVTVSNATARVYKFDPADVALIEKDGGRMHPLPLDVAVQQVAEAERHRAAANGSTPADDAEVARRLEGRLLRGHSVSANQTLKGYLFFPLGAYVKGRVALEDEASEETEGFVVEF